MAIKATKEYTFDFANGYYNTGRPILKRCKIRGNTISEAENKLRKRYPHARFVSLMGRIRELKR